MTTKPHDRCDATTSRSAQEHAPDRGEDEDDPIAEVEVEHDREGAGGQHESPRALTDSDADAREADSDQLEEDERDGKLVDPGALLIRWRARAAPAR